METKHKVILVVFAAFFAVVFLIFIFGGKPKVEHYKDDDEEEEELSHEDYEEEKPKAKKQDKETKDTRDTKDTKDTQPAKEKEEASSTNIDKQPINYVKEAMNYLNTMNLPFQLKKEVFTELFSEEGMNKLEKMTALPDVQKFVTNIIDMTTGSSKTVVKEKFYDSSLITGLEDVKKQINNLSQSLFNVTSTIEKFEKEASATPSPNASKEKHRLSSHADTTASNVIEGFENIRSNYALF